MGFCRSVSWLCVRKLRVTQDMRLSLSIFPVRNYFISSAIYMLATRKHCCVDPSRNVHFCSTLNLLFVDRRYCKVFTINIIHSLFLKPYTLLLQILETSFTDHSCSDRICTACKLLMNIEVDTILQVIQAFEIMFFQFPKTKPHSKE